MNTSTITSSEEYKVAVLVTIGHLAAALFECEDDVECGSAVAVRDKDS